MKRFLLFYGENYYPTGGWNDFHGAFDTLDDAVAAAETGNTPVNPKFDWGHVVDTEDLEAVPHTWRRHLGCWS